MIINSIEEINQYLRANSTLQPDSIFPFIPDAIEQYLKPCAGEVLVSDVTAMNDGGTTSDEFSMLPENIRQQLLFHCQGIVARFSFFLGAPSLDLQITESGFGVVSNNNLAPASKDRVKTFVDSVEKLGWTSIENFLKFLDENKAALADYHLAYHIPAYGSEYDLFINSALEFDRHFKIEKSRLFFQKIQPVIQTVEQLKIEPVLSKELCDAIKSEMSAGSISHRSQVILPYLKKAVIYFTVAEDLFSFFPKSLMEFKYTELWKAFVHDEKSKYLAIAEKYLSLAKNTVVANAADYPEYVASAVFEDVTTRVNIYETGAEDKFYTFQ